MLGSPANEGWDVVVIGGGIGGLAAAAYSARAGKRTLLLEARDNFFRLRPRHFIASIKN
jgi:thioredoxin reductase